MNDYEFYIACFQLILVAFVVFYFGGDVKDLLKSFSRFVDNLKSISLFGITAASVTDDDTVVKSNDGLLSDVVKQLCELSPSICSQFDEGKSSVRVFFDEADFDRLYELLLVLDRLKLISFFTQPRDKKQLVVISSISPILKSAISKLK